MNKILNVPENFVSETLEGILLASNQKLLSMDKDNRVIVSNYPCKPNKVGIVTAGGSGHLPTFLGYVGKGMLDGCTVGNVFASPSASKMADTIRACDKGSGVLCLYGNYGGDHMNFTMAREEVEFDGINTAAVRVTDDVASSKNKNLRRGVAGMVFAFKVAGAAADRMYSLEDVERVANKANDNIRSMGVALTPCIIPEVGKPGFSIPDGKIEIGMGIHGEPGIMLSDRMPADELVDMLMKKLLDDMPLAERDRVSVMINGLGATSLEEQIFAEGTTLDNMMKEIQAKNGIEFCGFFVEGIAGIGTTKEVSNPNTLDSKNTVIRTAAMDCYILPCEYMGFDTTSIASSDTFAALQTGVVEGLAGSTPAGAYLNYRDIIDYYYVYQMSPEVTQIMISEKTLAKLSPEDQKTIVDICRQECANSVNYAKEEDEKYLKLMEDNGIKIVRFSDEEIEMFAEAVRTNVWPNLAKTYGEDFINELLKLYK